METDKKRKSKENNNNNVFFYIIKYKKREEKRVEKDWKSLNKHLLCLFITIVYAYPSFSSLSLSLVHLLQNNNNLANKFLTKREQMKNRNNFNQINLY